MISVPTSHCMCYLSLIVPLTHYPAFNSVSFFLNQIHDLKMQERHNISLHTLRITHSSSIQHERSTPSSSSWSVSEESLRRYVRFASESCIQELLSSSEAGRFGNASNGWKVVRHDPNGVEISKRDTGSLHSFRSRRILTSISPDQFVKVANAIDAAKQWEGDLVEATHIRNIDENLSVIRLRFGENSKPLFRNREFIVYERRETMQDGTLVVAVASLPKEMAEGLEPTKKKKNNSIRGFLVESGWVLEKLDDSSCMITYVVQLDPIGWLPKCFVNRLNTKLVMVIDNLRKLAQASLPSLPPP